MFSFEFCEISKNTFFIEYLRWLLLIMETPEKMREICSKLTIKAPKQRCSGVFIVKFKYI